MVIPPSIPIPIVAPVPITATPAAAADSGKKSRQHDQHDQHSGHNADDGKATGNTKTPQQLSNEERAEVQRLAQRDREVRAHEAAHKGAAGRYARGGAEYEYERGPDGRQYAVAGEVSIDVSKPNDPKAALQKALLIQRAALAPAQPSAQDRAVAAEAIKMASDARAEIRQQQAEDETAGQSKTQSIERSYATSEAIQQPEIDISV